MYLCGKKVLLRRFREQDLPSLHRMLNAPEVQWFTEENYPVNWSEEVILQFYARAFKGRKEMFAIETLSGLFVGEVWLDPISYEHSYGEMVLTISPDYQGSGFGREAIELILRHGFNNLNLHRIEVKVYSFNHRAHQLYLRCGFQEEGRLRERIQRDGVYYDQIYMGILQQDYLLLKERNQT